ncbi:MAG: UbiA family prenyltransferase [bacterium]|nr:UbiA family prenyltransferase [bacterium]
MIHFLDYIFLMRPTLLVPGWTFFLIGFYRTGISQRIPVLAFVSATLMMGGIYVINQIMDIESDRINKKLYLLPEGYISVKQAWIEAILLFALAFVCAIPYPLRFKVLLFVSFIGGILYSVPPFQFKGRPILDLFSNSFGYGLVAFSLGWAAVRHVSFDTILYALPYLFAVGAVFINTTIPDMEGDRKSGKITTGVLMGNNAYLFSTILVIVSFILCVYLKDWLCGITSIIAIPLFLLAYIKRNLTYCFLSIRISAPILVLLTAVKFLWFALVLVIIFLGMRMYYKYRFNIIYPKING